MIGRWGNHRLLILTGFLALFLLVPSAAYAACINPAANEGVIVYNADQNTPQVCTGSSWVALGALNPSAGGGSCSSPAAIEGAIVYNNDFDVLQYCDGTNWIAIGNGPPPSGPTGCPTIGDVCSDGSVYAGLSPDGNVAMYTTPADAGGIAWNNGNGSGYTTTSQTSTITGDANTAAIIGIDSDSGTGGTQPHLAAQTCTDLTDHGQTDWYLPSQDELNVLYTNNAAIGGFNLSGSYPGAYYWSSSESNNSDAWNQRFSDGDQTGHGKYGGLSVRCVRK